MELTRPVTVQFDALSTKGPYQQWQADEAKCPSCGAIIAFRYGDGPSWQSFEKDKIRDDPTYVVQEGAKPAPRLRRIFPVGGAPAGLVEAKNFLIQSGAAAKLAAPGLDETLVLAFLEDLKNGCNADSVRDKLSAPTRACLEEAERRFKEIMLS